MILKIAALPEPSNRDINEQFIVPLHLIMTVEKKNVIQLNPILRLTYRALAFFQWRLAAVYLRDVKDSDETRDY